MTDLVWVLERLNWLAALDIALVALVIFAVLQLVRATQAIPLLRGVLLIVTLSALMSGLSQLPTFGSIARTIVPALLVSIPIIFQPELRRVLERLGRFGEVITVTRRSHIETEVRTICDAAQRLAAMGHGALIVMERETGLQHLIETGTKIEAVLSVPLLLTIFYPKTSLHDGGVIVHNSRLLAAGCVLPLSNIAMDYNLGLRHRAGIGVSESTDAISIIVSEETGTISVASEGKLTRNVDVDALEQTILDMFRPQLQRAQDLLPGWLRPKPSNPQPNPRVT